MLLHTEAGLKEVIGAGPTCYLQGGLPDELCHVAAASFHLDSLILFLQKVPLFPNSCLQWCWWRGSFHNHCLHLRLLRKYWCHMSSKHAAQRWTGPNCQDDSEGLRLAIIRLRSMWLPCLHRNCVESCFFSKDGLQTACVKNAPSQLLSLEVTPCRCCKC